MIATNLWAAAGSIGLGFKIQSVKDPAFVEERVDSFLQTYRDNLATMDLEFFNSHKSALVDLLLERPKNLAEEASTFWHHIDSGYLDFLQSD